MLGKERKRCKWGWGAVVREGQTSALHISLCFPPPPAQLTSERYVLNSRDFTGPRSGGR